MKLYLLIVGVNNYTAGVKRLTHCINDAKEWSSFFKNDFDHPIEKEILLTKAKDTNSEKIRDCLESMLKDAQKEDHIIFIFSGHGDLNKRIIDGKTYYEESIRSRNKLISENIISELIKKTNPDVNFISIVDSCFSGGLDFDPDKFQVEKVTKRFSRNLELKTSFPLEDLNKVIEEIENKTAERKSFSSALNGKNQILVSACGEKELAYGLINANGLLTHYALRELRKTDGLTYNQLIQNLHAIKDLTDLQKPQVNPVDSKWADKQIFTHN